MVPCLETGLRPPVRSGDGPERVTSFPQRESIPTVALPSSTDLARLPVRWDSLEGLSRAGFARAELQVRKPVRLGRYPDAGSRPRLHDRHSVNLLRRRSIRA